MHCVGEKGFKTAGAWSPGLSVHKHRATDSEEEEAALEALLAKSAAAAKRSRHAGGESDSSDGQPVRYDAMFGGCARGVAHILVPCVL